MRTSDVEPRDDESPDDGRIAPASAQTFRGAFDQLYREAYRVAYRLLGNREDAADIAQETLARAYARWRSIGPSPRRGGWIATVSANLALDAGRRRGSAIAAHARYGAPAPPGVLAERIDLHRALRALPRRQREVVILRYLADLPEIVVAGTLGISAGAVKQHASRGLAALRATLGPDGT